VKSLRAAILCGAELRRLAKHQIQADEFMIAALHRIGFSARMPTH